MSAYKYATSVYTITSMATSVFSSTLYVMQCKAIFKWPKLTRRYPWVGQNDPLCILFINVFTKYFIKRF